MKLDSVNNIEKNKYELIVTVDGSAFEQAINKAYLKNVKKINVSGFRKGKAPRKMVEKLYGEGVFFEDAVNSLYPIALQQAVEQANLELVSRPEVEITEVSAKDGFKFKAICVVKPEVEIKDYKGIKVDKKVKNIMAAEVNVELENLRERNARTINVEDRAAKKSDITIIDFEGFVDGDAFEGGKGEDFELTLGSGQFIPGFEEQIIGHKISDEFDVNVEFPKEYHAENLAGKPAVFKVKLNEIKSKELPILDDEFAKDVSEFETLAELKKDTKAKLQAKENEIADEEVENKLIDSVIEKLESEIPQEMFDTRIEEMVQDFEYKLKSQGMNLELYLQYTGMDMDSFRKTFEEQANKQVQVKLALEKIVELENISCDDKDIETKYEELAKTYGMEVEKIKTFINPKDLANDIKIGKAIDLIKDSAEITEEVIKKAPAKKTTKKTEE